MYAHSLALWDVVRGNGGAARRRLRRDLSRAYATHRFRAIIIDGPHEIPRLQGCYRKQSDVFDRKDVFWPVTGYPSRPKAVFVPN